MTSECQHCGSPCPTGAVFCCVGCDAVWHALDAGGLQNFYALRQGAAMPVMAGERRLFDAPAETLADGTSCATVGVDGTHCAGCVWLVERMPMILDGVVDARLNLGRGRLEVRWDPALVGYDRIDAWLRQFGYSTYALDVGRGEPQRVIEREALVRVGLSWVLAANTMLLAVALYAGLAADDTGLWTAARWLSMLLSGASMAYGGRQFFRRAWLSMRTRGQLSVDVPVALGLAVGWTYSALATVRGAGDVWFDSVAVLIAALLTARWLHARGLRVASDAMDRLATLLPRTARRVGDGAIEVIDALTLQVGDLCEVRSGDVVPADGRIVEGRGALDRSLLTGESEPVPAGPGLEVWAGETNTRGRLLMRVRVTGDDTRFGQLARFVSAERAGGATVRLADRLATWFIAAILGGALLTAVLAGIYAPAEAVPRIVALLVVSCPCALGMATPLAFTVALGRAARAGIFVRGDTVFESLRRVDAIVLDKTGTLTQGAMSVVSIEGDPDVLRLAAAAERASAHPIAAAFAAYDQGAQVEEFDELAGRGVIARVDGAIVEVCGGEDGGIEVRVDGARRAVIRLGDPIRPDAAELVQSLAARGVEIWLASGDHDTAVTQVAARVGIDPTRTLARCTPEGKLDLIHALQAQGRVVAMVGDGVNDAGALRQADVGVAMHGGVDLNALAADVQLGRPGVRAIADLFVVSDEAMAAVRRNLWFSASYNIVAIAAAGLGFVGPLAAAVAMPLSSLAVVASSLLQGRRVAGRQPFVAPLLVPEVP